jgi:hypothetical protein
MTSLEKLARLGLVSAALATALALGGTVSADSNTSGNATSNPDAKVGDTGHDSNLTASNGAAPQTQGTSDYDNNNGLGNDNDFCDDALGDKSCENKEIPFAPALAYPAVGALTFAAAYGTRRIRRRSA